MVQAIPIGNRVELMVDRHLIADMRKVKFKLNPPERKEIVLRMERPWEGKSSGIYSCVFRDGDKFRMYYRGTAELVHDDMNDGQFACYAESVDGVHWERPNLGLVEFNGSSMNNILMKGHLLHNFSPFLDENPDCPADRPYKAISGNYKEGLVGYTSADGVHWERIREDPLITEGAFDSHNLAFWDPNQGSYVCYSRYFRKGAADTPMFSGIRAIQSCTSTDFLTWSAQRPNTYGEGVPYEHFYTNAVTPCPGAEHLYLSFPMRFMPERNKIEGFPKVGISDNIFMTSRDGIHWDREFLESWTKPGLDPKNWTERSLIVARGVIETSPNEFSFYINEHYEWEDAYIRRLTIPRHRFASIHAGYEEGSFITKPLVFEGNQLVLNYGTSAIGSVNVQFEEASGEPIDGFRFEDFGELYGDELGGSTRWGERSDVSVLAGKPVCLRFRLRDADVYAFQFRSSEQGGSGL